MSTALAPLLAALVVAFKADALFMADATGVWALQAPEKTPGDYLVLGDVVEQESNTIGRVGNRQVVTVHLWAAKERRGLGGARETITGHTAALTLWAHVERILQRQRLVVAGHRHRIGRVQLLTMVEDPGGRYTHGIARYESRTLAGVAA